MDLNTRDRDVSAGFAIAFACVQLAVTALYFALARAMPPLESPLLAVFVLMQFVAVELILFHFASRVRRLDPITWLTAVLKGMVLGAVAFSVVALISAVILREVMAIAMEDLANASAPLWLAALLVAPCFGVYYSTRGNLLGASGWEVMFAAGLFYGVILMVESYFYEGLLQQAGWGACKPADCTSLSLAVYLPLVAVFGVIESVPFAWAYRRLLGKG